MINKIKKRAVFSLLALGLAASFICVSVGITERNEPVFVPRMSEPEYSNYYYYSENIFYNSGYGIPNCTAYAWGRVYELLKTKPELSTGNARDWYSYNADNGIYDYGQTPKLGAVACFDNEYGGHVAVVEEINGDEITFSNSAYNGKSFYLSYAGVDDDNPGQRGWTFQGYIYPADFKYDTKTMNLLRKVSVEDGLNFREYAGINADIIDVIPQNDDIFISTVFENDGYIWGKAYYNGKAGYCVVDYTVSV